MISTPAVIDVPLRADKDGAVRIGNTRILLEVVIACHQRGDTPEEIMDGFPTLQLADVYAVISYYLHHRSEVDEYIRQVDARGEEIRRKFEAEYPDKTGFRERMLALIQARKGKIE